MRTALYRHFAASGLLLYVGVSLSAVQRLAQHKSHAHWFGQIARVDIEWFDSRQQALDAEDYAILFEGPLHNIVRPRVSFDAWETRRNIPEPWEANEVRCVGDPLDEVIWQGRQWAVTECGIEARDGCYVIERDRLREDEKAGRCYGWVRHMRDKAWVDVADFERAFAIACWVFRGEPCSFAKPGFGRLRLVESAA